MLFDALTYQRQVILPDLIQERDLVPNSYANTLVLEVEFCSHN
jgi:hypothetical protein